MTAPATPLRQGVKFFFHAVGSIVLWTCWLALAALLAVQIWWMSARELAVPDFLLRSLEARLAQSQLHATFGHTAFDPTGRVLVEDVKLFSPTFNEPLLTARSIYLRLDPWELLAGNFEPDEMSASGISLFVPAMLSSSGQAEALASEIEATVIPGEHEIEIPQLTARIGPLTVVAHGAINLGARPKSNSSSRMADVIAKDFPRLSRRLADYLEYLRGLDEPRLDLDLSPSASRGAIVSAVLSVKSVELTKPVAVKSSHVIVRTRFPLVGETSTVTRLDLTADDLRLPNQISIGQMRAMIRGVFRPDARSFTPEEADLTASWIQAAGFMARPAAATLVAQGETWHGVVTTGLGNEPITLTADADLTKKAGQVHFEGRVSPVLLPALSTVVKRDLSALIELSQPIDLTANVTLGPGWKLSAASAHLTAENLVARDVPLDFVSANVVYAGTAFDATDVVLRTRGNVARGTYSMNLETQDYRFLLNGQLRPTDINGWFGSWWPNFFDGFKFGEPRPEADVDVQGRWGEPRLSLQFVQVRAPDTAIRGVYFNDVRATLFIRPGYYDGLEVLTTQGPGFLRGNFTYVVEPGIGTMRTLDFVSTSTIDILSGASIFGDSGVSIVEPFRFSAPPRLQLKGHIDGPGSPNGAHETVQINAQSKGAFGLFDFPLSNVSFLAELHDDDLSVHDVKMNFADGSVSGHARMWGRADKRRLSFDVALAGADLGKAVQQVEQFAARRKPTAGADNSSVFEKPGVHLDLTAAAEGSYDDLFSFQGKGEAMIAGEKLGEIRLLGAMSDLFNFTALRFTDMTTNFKINGPRLEFADVRLTGANSSVTAHGSYALDRKALDFNAKLFPFAESKFIPQVIIGAVLAPLSQFLEVHLTGSLEKPSWEFVRGPRNFLRSLGGSPRTTPPVAAPAPVPARAILRTNKELSPFIKRKYP